MNDVIDFAAVTRSAHPIAAEVQEVALPAPEPSLLYFMATGEIVFQLKDGDAPSAIRMNAISMSNDGRIGLNQLGRLQQQLQANFFEKLQDPTIQILDVVILNLVCLGSFTNAEFNHRPTAAPAE